MRRPLFASLALTAVLATSFLALTSRAQEATPAAEGMELPPGVALAVLGELAPFAPPADTTGLVVLRLSLEPGAKIPSHPHPEFGVIEAGSVTARTYEGEPIQVIRGAATGAQIPASEAAAGEEVTANAGDVFLVPAGNVSDTRAGDQGTSVLIFEFAPVETGATPAA